MKQPDVFMCYRVMDGGPYDRKTVGWCVVAPDGERICAGLLSMAQEKTLAKYPKAVFEKSGMGLPEV